MPIDPAQLVCRCERQAPGAMTRIDIAKLGRFDRVGRNTSSGRSGQSSSRGLGWEFVHVCVDDTSRIALPGERQERILGITVEQMMTASSQERKETEQAVNVSPRASMLSLRDARRGVRPSASSGPRNRNAIRSPFG